MSQADGGEALDSSRDVCVSVYVACLETLFITKSLKTRQAKFSLSFSLFYSLSHTHTYTFPRLSTLSPTMIFTSSTPNYSLTLIEYLAESEGGDGVHWARGSSVLVIGPIR